MTAETDRLETEYDKHRLAALIQSGGIEGGPALAPAHDETPEAGERRRQRATRRDADDADRGDRMTDTVVGSATKTVVIGDDRPFVIIGERINPTGRAVLMEEMKAGDFSRVERDTIAQVEAGAHMLDVNAGIPLADEPAILARTIQLVQCLTDLPLCIDSSIVEALEAGLAVYQGKALVNSVTGEEERLERVLPLVRKYGAAVVAISNDETGISMDPDVRFAVAKRIVERAARPRHPEGGHRRRPAADADRGDADGRPPGLPDPGPAARRAEGQLDLRRLERELRVAAPRGDQRRLPRDGDGERPHVGDHEPDRGGCPRERHGRRRPARQRPRRRPLDPDPPCRAARRRGRRPADEPADGPAPRRAGAADADARLPTTRAARHLHALGPARPVRDRDDGARRGPGARRRHRLGLRRARDLRPLPGRAERRQLPEARDRVEAGQPEPARPGRGGLPRASKGLDAGRRLSCTAHVRGDVVVDVPPESQVYRQVVRKGLELRELTSTRSSASTTSR